MKRRDFIKLSGATAIAGVIGLPEFTFYNCIGLPVTITKEMVRDLNIGMDTLEKLVSQIYGTKLFIERTGRPAIDKKFYISFFTLKTNDERDNIRWARIEINKGEPS